MNKKKATSTYERLMEEDTEFEKDLSKRYKDFILSELLLAIMQDNPISIRKLAHEAGVSPSLIQDLRSGKKDNLTLRSFSSILDSLGYDLVVEKRKKKVPQKRFKMASSRRKIVEI